jgi:4-hydroxy-tetrahydrodipicolinate reductase
VKVGVFGAAGRMGTTVSQAVEAAPDLTLAAAVDPAGDGGAIRPDREAMTEAGVEVAIDFTVPSAAVDNALWCATNGIHAVIGTSGVGGKALDRLEAAFPERGRLACLVVPNFAVGAVLMMRFAELAAPWFDTAEIVELHHDAKVDAPSGTAVQTAERIAAASSEWASDPTRVETVAGSRGGVGPGGIRIHSVRLRGLVAHQEVLLGAAGQTLTIRHDSLDRQSFVPGILLALRRAGERPGLTVGLDRLLGI